MDDKKKKAGSGGESLIDVESYLNGVDYPATKQDLIDMANENDAPDEIMARLDMISDKEYSSPADVSKETSKAK